MLTDAAHLTEDSQTEVRFETQPSQQQCLQKAQGVVMDTRKRSAEAEQEGQCWSWSPCTDSVLIHEIDSQRPSPAEEVNYVAKTIWTDWITLIYWHRS